jgi:hypothetical protein
MVTSKKVEKIVGDIARNGVVQSEFRVADSAAGIIELTSRLGYELSASEVEELQCWMQSIVIHESDELSEDERSAVAGGHRGAAMSG